MRGMILNNDREHRHSGQPTALARGQQTNQRISSRPSQAQRRQQPGQIHAVQQPVQHVHAQAPPQAPHLRGLMSSSQAPTAPSSTNKTTNQPRFAQNQTYDRPPAPRKQLYDPSSSGLRHNRYHQAQPQSVSASAEAKVGYLDLAAHRVVPKAAMDVEEYNMKDRLRVALQRICRRAISEYEMIKGGGDFAVDTVELKCFGSMSTTFATKGSDMDLVLVSPISKPDASTPESEIPRLIEKALLDAGYGVRLLTKTRVPIIRFCESPSPELRELLLKERVKFEEERDAPRAAPQKKGKRPKDVKEDRPDPTLPQNRPSDFAEPKVALQDDDARAIVKTEEQIIEESADIDGSSLSPQSTKLETGKAEEGHEGKGSISMGTESADPGLSSKPDEERIRLYRLAIQEGWYEPAERQIITSYMQAIRRKTATDDEKANARALLKDLPNVIGRYRPPPEAHPLEFPKSGVGIQCDINFSNQLALHNSHLLKCYSLCDFRVREMVLFVKAWTKRRKINTPYHGTLSSYGYVLMVLHYLVNIAQPAVLPNLQQIPLAFEDDMSAKVVELEGHNIRFFRNEAAIEGLLKRRAITKNTETLGSLLQGFFHYYAQQGYQSPAGGFSWSLDVLSLRTVGGHLRKQAKGWTGAKTETVELKGPGPQQTKDIRQRYLFAIEDPFEIEHNIARTVVHNGIVAIRDEFRRAHRLIEHAGMLPGRGMEDLLAEAEDRENLQYRAFGPRPRNGPAKSGNDTPNAGNGTAASAAPAC